MNNLGTKENITAYLNKMADGVELNSSIEISGIVTKITGMKIEATGLNASIGTICKIYLSNNVWIMAEVIGFSNEACYLMAIDTIEGIKPGSMVQPLSTRRTVVVGGALLGRILDAVGNPIDNKGQLHCSEYYPLYTKPLNPLARKKIDKPLDVGVRAINALLTVGKGQRIGIVAGTGVGKSVLLGMMTRFTKADIVVVGLVGERGREVKEFIEDNLGEEGLRKSVVIAAPADNTPLMRANAALSATSIAEYYRDQGKDVLLIIDSLTRYAQAQREISLASGELPATKGFTPSVFAKISSLVERSGNGNDNQGSITAFYTVLMEEENSSDPVTDHIRSVLDGHIVLSRQLADSGHYPAIDVEQSISRVMIAVVDNQHLTFAHIFKQLYSSYSQNRDIVNIGMYQAGTDKILDEALRYKDGMLAFLRQGLNESSDLDTSKGQLLGIFN